mgnify:CR=1 FL=1
MAQNDKTKDMGALVIEREETLRIDQSGDRVLILRDTRSVTYQALMPKKDMLIAELSVALIEDYGYSITEIQTCSMIRIDEPAGDNEKYVEADIIIRGSGKKPSLIIEVLDAKQNIADMREKAWQKLFSIGSALQSEINGSLFLAVCECAPHECRANAPCTAVNFRAFPNLAQWKNAGKPHIKTMPHANE